MEYGWTLPSWSYYDAHGEKWELSWFLVECYIGATKTSDGKIPTGCKIAKRQTFTDLLYQVHFAGMLFYLRFKYEHLKLEGVKVLATILTATYSGNVKYGSASNRQTAQTAMRLPGSIVRLVRDTGNQEPPEICLRHEWMNRVGAITINEIIELGDCRPFSNFLHTSSLKSSTVFMKGRVILSMERLHS